MDTQLTKREQMVLALLRQGRSNKEIGAVLGISPRTVQKHLQRIYWQLEVQTRAQAIVKVYEQARAYQLVRLTVTTQGA